MPQLVAALFEGPLDVVGDVHGEFEALRSLLARLGYDRHGEHRQGRRLVFLGDLVDRGPDSPGVLRFVESLVARDLAQCIVGNHELNLLRRQMKHGNHWFYGPPTAADLAQFGEAAWIRSQQQQPIHDFLDSLPLVLERPDLRLVHAAWDDAAVEACREAPGAALESYRAHDVRVEAELVEAGLKDAAMREQYAIGAALHDPARQVPLLPALAQYDALYQVKNPVRVLTSGIEQPAAEPFFVSGKWRMVERVPWWQAYAHPVPVVFGHYWRWLRPESHGLYSKGERNLFEGADPTGWLATAGKEGAFCLDYSVGSRFKQRLDPARRAEPFHGRLAALRWPERELVFD